MFVYISQLHYLSASPYEFTNFEFFLVGCTPHHHLVFLRNDYHTF